MALILVVAFNYFFQIVQILLLVWVLMSWFRPSSYSRETRWFFQIYHFIGRLIEPLLAPIRRIIPPFGGMIDLSPLFLILILRLLQQVLIRALLRF